MKKIKTILIVLLLAIVSLFGFVGCVSSSQSELQSKIDELQSRIEELEEQIRERDERIKELEKENVGTLYTLQEAYDNGYLTKEDLEQIAYHVNENELSGTLDSKIERAIKEAEADIWRNRANHPEPEATAEEFTIEKYFGVYGRCYVVGIDNVYIGYPANGNRFLVDGVEFYTLYYYIKVWKID